MHTELLQLFVVHSPSQTANSSLFAPEIAEDCPPTALQGWHHETSSVRSNPGRTGRAQPVQEITTETWHNFGQFQSYETHRNIIMIQKKSKLVFLRSQKCQKLTQDPTIQPSQLPPTGPLWVPRAGSLTLSRCSQAVMSSASPRPLPWKKVASSCHRSLVYQRLVWYIYICVCVCFICVIYMFYISAYDLANQMVIVLVCFRRWSWFAEWPKSWMSSWPVSFVLFAWMMLSFVWS